MNIKQITDEAEKSITEDMQKAIDAKDQWQAEIFFQLGSRHPEFLAKTDKFHCASGIRFI